MLVIAGHDVVYLFAAGVLSVLSGFSVRWLHQRTQDESGAMGGLWLALRAVTGGSGVWAANVLATLGYRPGYSWTLDPWSTTLALGAAIVAVAPITTSRSGAGRARHPLIALRSAFAFTLVHFVVIAGIHAPGPLHWDGRLQAAGVLVLIGLSLCAWAIRQRRSRPATPVTGVGFNAAGIASLHLLSFAGLSGPAAVLGPAVATPSPVYGMAVAIVALALIGIASSASLLAAMGEQKALVRLRSATNAMPNALALFDANSRLVVWNASFERILGLHAVAVREGMTLAELPPVEGLPRVPIPRQRRHVEFFSPTHLWVRIDDIPTEDGGLLTMTTDITDLRRSRDALERALERAQAGSRAKSEFLATMSHEIRTPLNGVLGMAYALGAEPLTPTQREKLQVIQQGGDALLSVLNNVLDLSKIEAGRISLEDGVVDFRQVADVVQGIFSAVAAEKDLALTVSVSQAASGCWRGDPMRVQQILQNLVSNAVKFTEAGSVTIDIYADEPGVALRVADTGPGVPRDYQTRIFQAFTQADASTTRRFGGSGLGLSICLALVRLMGGDIQLHSAPGQGSTFTVRLPLSPIAPPARQAAALRAAPSGSLAGLPILAAEDNAMNQLVLRTLLEPFGVTPQIVANGEDAVSAWASGRWGVILMDVQMPVMDGPTAARLIRARERELGLPRTPIIALTANAMSHHVQDYLACGMDRVVSKPINVTELIQAIQGVRQTAEADVA